jgi:hypothetical protein
MFSLEPDPFYQWVSCVRCLDLSIRRRACWRLSTLRMCRLTLDLTKFVWEARMGPMSKGLMFQPSKQKARLTSDSYWQGPTLGRKFLAKGSWVPGPMQLYRDCITRGSHCLRSRQGGGVYPCSSSIPGKSLEPLCVNSRGFSSIACRRVPNVSRRHLG